MAVLSLDAQLENACRIIKLKLLTALYVLLVGLCNAVLAGGAAREWNRLFLRPW
jgi:hypothetical protein